MLQGIYFFVIGAFAGWMLEVVFKIINKDLRKTPGMLHGPFCILYGIATVFLSLIISKITANFFYLFLWCMVASTLLEYITYVILDKIYDVELWDYSDMKFNYKGRICLEFSILWGILGALYIKFALPYLIYWYNVTQGITFNISILMLVLFIGIDFVFSSYKLLLRRAESIVDEI